jgi:NTP pyrophosphatase (non-canonical NTP hydrolase)
VTEVIDIKREDVLHAIQLERKRQDALHPLWKGDDHGLAVLVEEVGEVAKALYELRNLPIEVDDVELEYKSKRESELMDELIQVAAVCVRWLENRDKPDSSRR